jgi:hypothetical protein
MCMVPPTATRARKRRAALRAAGLRSVQIWVPDTRRLGFAEEARRQSHIAAASDLVDTDLLTFIDAALANPTRRSSSKLMRSRSMRL